MKSTLLHKQHTKCLAIIEMIQQCDKYIANCGDNLKVHFNLGWIDRMPGVESYNMRNIRKYTLIRSRLMQYYKNQFTKMIEPVNELIEVS